MKVRKYIFTFIVPADELDPDQSVTDDLNAIKNKELSIYDLDFLANDRESDTYCVVNVTDTEE